MSEEEEEAIRKIEKFLDYGEMISVREIAIFYMLWQKEYDKNKKEYEKSKKLEKIISIIRNKLKYDVIIEEDGIYKPCKNLSKQEVYKTYSEIIDLLKADYCFMDTETAIKEILKEMGVN